MKKLFTILCLIFLLNTSAQCAESASGALGQIEQSIWGFEYKSETDAQRLKRIEESVLGSQNTKASTAERIKLLNQTLGIDSPEDAETVARQVQDIQSEGVSYPMVDKLELKVLSQTHSDENIYTRLERLEKKLYGTKQEGDLDQRIGKIAAGARVDVMSTPGGNPDLYMQISSLETVLFKQTYDQDPLELRLNRLERKIFQRDFSSDDEDQRLQRLQAAASAKKTAKYYDANKAAKYASTGIQVGTFILMILAFVL